MGNPSAHNEKFRRGYFFRLKRHRSTDHTDYILSALRSAKTADDRWYVRHTLIGEFVRLGRNADAEKLLLEDVEADPNDPLPLMSLATHYHYTDRLTKAKTYIRRAVAVAQKKKTLVYGTLGQQARIAISANDWPFLARALKDMTAYRHRTGNADCFPEADFLARIPPGAVSQRVVTAYQMRRAYLSSIRYSTLYGRGGAPSNSTQHRTRARASQLSRRRAARAGERGR